jgi:hypothetical protein
MNVDLKITAANVPADLQHKTRALEIAELPQFLKVSMNTGPNGQLSFVNYGSQEPSQDNRDKPWVRVDPNTGKAGFYFYSNGKWTAITGGLLGVTLGTLAVTPSAPTGIVAPMVLTASGGYPPYSWINTTPRAGTLVVGGDVNSNNQATFSPTFLQTGGTIILMDSASQIAICTLTVTIPIAMGGTPSINGGGSGSGVFPVTFNVYGSGVSNGSPFSWVNVFSSYFTLTPSANGTSVVVTKTGSPPNGLYTSAVLCIDKYGGFIFGPSLYV